MPQDPSQTPHGRSILQLLIHHPEGLTTQAIATATDQTVMIARSRLSKLGGKGWVRQKKLKRKLVWFPSEKLMQNLGYETLDPPKNVP